jgi:ferric iron reductase protein FhuF
VIRATGERLGTDDPVVAASLFVQNYSYRVLTLAVACLTTAGVVPHSSASSMSITLANGRPSIVGYTKPMALVIGCEESEVSTRLQQSEAISDAFGFVIAHSLENHIATLIDSTRARIRVGARLLWGNVAASAAVAFRTMEGCLGQWVQPLGERFFEIAPAELKGLGSFFALEFAGRRGWYWERTNCCLYDRLPGDIRCGDCSRTPTQERRASYLASLKNP